jgi:ParB-like chromosome segregation protein Spo0J
MKAMKVHEAALAFPRLPAKEMRELQADIEKRGIRVPILVNKGRDTILDGRNRYMIAHDLKLKEADVPFEVYKGKEEDIPNEVLSRNVMRRHLNDDQRTMLVAKILGPQLEKQAAEAKKAGKFVEGNGKGETADRVAKAAQTTQHKARQALDVTKHAREMVDKVVSGDASLKKAGKVAKGRKPRKTAPKPAKTLKEVVASRFQTWIDYWPQTQHREVKKHLRDLL